MDEVSSPMAKYEIRSKRSARTDIAFRLKKSRPMLRKTRFRKTCISVAPKRPAFRRPLAGRSLALRIVAALEAPVLHFRGVGGTWGTPSPERYETPRNGRRGRPEPPGRSTPLNIPVFCNALFYTVGATSCIATRLACGIHECFPRST